MAERRMFAKTIVTSDAFLDMPMSARCLYFTLGMFADDDGFVNNPKSILRQIGASEDDMRVLLGKKFILTFDTGVIVIKHWRINNYLRNDRYHETTYVEEKKQLSIDKNGAYTESGIPMVYQRYTESSLDKTSIDKTSIDKSESIDGTPTQDDVKNYCKERENSVDAERFFNYYEARGWKVNGQPVRDWKALLRTWETKEGKRVSMKSLDKDIKELEEKRKELVESGASKEEIETVDLNIISLQDAEERIKANREVQ